MHDLAPVILMLGILALGLWHAQQMYRIKRETARELGEPQLGAKSAEGLPTPEGTGHDGPVCQDAE